MPLEQNRRRDFNVVAKLFRGMSAQEQAIEESRLPLRKVEIVLSFLGRIGRVWERRVGFSLHRHLETEEAVYRKFSRRQVVRLYRDDNFTTWGPRTNDIPIR